MAQKQRQQQQQQQQPSQTPIVQDIVDVSAFTAFVQSRNPRILICCRDALSGTTCGLVRSAVEAAMRAHLSKSPEEGSGSGWSSNGIEAAMWDVRPFPSATEMLGIEATADVTLLVMVHGQFQDTLVGSSAINSEFDGMAQRLKKYLNSGVGVAHVVDNNNNNNNSKAVGSSSQQHDGSTTGVEVNVAKMIAMGKELMGKSQPAYAEKFFAKALGVLDAVASEAGDNVSVNETTAVCLGWLLLAQIVQGTSVETNAAADRLEAVDGQLSGLVYDPLSDVLRALTARNLMRFAPARWSSATCSAKALSATLAERPTDAKTRAMLVVTLFLAGDMERCLTEALKLHVTGDDYGRVALAEVTRFLGREHPLVTRLGWRDE